MPFEATQRSSAQNGGLFGLFGNRENTLHAQLPDQGSISPSSAFEWIYGGDDNNDDAEDVEKCHIKSAIESWKILIGWLKQNKKVISSVWNK